MPESDDSAFSRILSAFRSRLSPEDINDFGVTTFDDLKLAISHIQRQQVQRRSLRNLNKIQPFLNGLGQYAQVIEVFVSAKPGFLAFIWGPIKFCLQIASRLTEAFDALLDAYEKLGKSLPIFSMIDSLFMSNAYVQQVLVDVYEDILDFHKRAIVVFKQRVWRLAFKITTNTFGDMFGDVIKKLERSKELLLQSANVAHFHEAQEARLLFSREIESLQERATMDRMLTVVDWLSPTSCTGDHEELRDKRLEFPDTAQWILKEPCMRDWLRIDDAAKRIFWICGIPGAGKTVLFSSIVDEIKVAIPDSQVLYFYCKNRDPTKRSFDEIARSLIAQLLQLNPISLDYLYEMAARSGERHPSTFKVYQDILENILISHNRLFIGIDGLDECEEADRRSTLSLMSHVLKASTSESNVKVFLTSQRVKDVQESLKSAIRFDIKHHHVKQDIHNYIRARSLKLCEKFGYGPEKQKSMIAEISSRPGTFLLARLIIDNLLNQDCIEDLEKELCSDTLPNGIDEAYGRILVGIRKGRTEKTQERIKRILEIILTARRPLRIHELQGALSIRIQDMSVEFMRRRSMTPFNELCGPLVEVHADDAVSLVHPTAKQYLIQYHSGPYIDIIAAELSMAKLCISYLTFGFFETSLQTAVLQEQVTVGVFAFQEYATLNWLYHITCLSTQNKQDNNGEFAFLHGKFRILESRHDKSSLHQVGAPSLYDRQRGSLISRAEFDRLQARYEAVLSISDSEECHDSIPYLLLLLERVRTIIEDLVVAECDKTASLTEAYGVSLFKCSILACPRFLQGFTNKKLRDEHCQTHRGRLSCTHDGCDYSVLGFLSEKELAEHLAEHDSRHLEITFPKVQRSSLNNALNYAIDQDDFLSTRRLSTEMSALPDRGTGFLLRAAKKKNLEAFKALVPALATKKDIESRDELGRAVLHHSARNGSEEMVKLVLEMGADVNINVRRGKSPVDRSRKSPLLVAASQGHSQIVKILLSQDKRDLDFGPAVCKTPLHFAAEGGHLEVLNMILDVDGAAYAQHKAYVKAIKSATSKGHESVVRTLFERGHVLDAEKNYPQALRELLRNGIEATIAQTMQPIDANGKTKGNVLQLAASKGNSEEVIRLLLAGADVNNSSGSYGTALAAAASHGNLTLVQLLLDNGADFSAKMGEYGTALEEAVAGSHEAVVRLLLENRSDLDTKSGWSTSALHQAVENDHIEIVSLLLDHKADVNGIRPWLSDSMCNTTPCQLAAALGREAILKLLLQHGADVNAGRGITALQRAKRSGHEGIVNLLREHGASLGEGDGSSSKLESIAGDGGGDVLEDFNFDSFLQSTDDGFKFDPSKLDLRYGSNVLNGEEGVQPGGDVLEDFDFDSFLQSTDDGFNFDPSKLDLRYGSNVLNGEEGEQPDLGPSK